MFQHKIRREKCVWLIDSAREELIRRAKIHENSRINMANNIRNENRMQWYMKWRWVCRCEILLQVMNDELFIDKAHGLRKFDNRSLTAVSEKKYSTENVNYSPAVVVARLQFHLKRYFPSCHCSLEMGVASLQWTWQRRRQISWQPNVAASQILSTECKVLSICLLQFNSIGTISQKFAHLHRSKRVNRFVIWVAVSIPYWDMPLLCSFANVLDAVVTKNYALDWLYLSLVWKYQLRARFASSTIRSTYKL